MKTINITCLLCVALLPSIIYGGGSSDRSDRSDRSGSEEDFEKPLSDTIARVNNIMRNNGTINKIFKPLRFLGMGGYSVTYIGELGQSKKIVAMKISSISMMEGDTVREYLMYTYLNAINNTAVENYGVPAIYYYHANWEGRILLALTLLEPEFTRLIDTPNIQLKDLDILIIMREFVRTTKYIHSCGVCHTDPHLDNMMFRKNQGFIIDFNWSKKVSVGVKPDSDCRKADWRSFIIKVCLVSGFSPDSDTNILNNVENMKNNDGLRLVLMNFINYAFKSAKPINYNKMYQIITREIRERGVQEPALVSWLTDAQKNEVIAEWSRRQPPDIKNIDEPKRHYTYPEPKLDKFVNFV